MAGTTYVEQLNIVEPLETDGGSGESLVRSPDGKIRKGTGGAGGSQNLQQTLENGSTGTVESDILIQHSTGANTASLGLTDGYVSASAGDNQFGLNEQEGSFTSQLRIFERLIVMSGGSSAEVAFSGTELNFIIDGIVRGSINAEGRLTIVNEDGFSGRFAPDNLTGSRTYALPDEDGEIALKENTIPLTGTETGSPVTGNLEVYAGFKVFSEETGYSELKFPDDNSGIEIIRTSVEGFSGTMAVSPSGITFTSDLPAAFGIRGAQDFSANYQSLDYVQKVYVDNLIAGLTFKTNVKAATTANIAIASAPASVDGVTLTNGDRVLLKNQTDATQNGIYIFNGTGSNLTRSTDADTGAELANKTIPVDQGTANADSWWTVTNDSITLGTTNITLSKTAGQGLYNAGTGIDITGSTISIAAAYTSARDAYADGKVAQTITNGVTTSAPSQDAVFDALALKQDISTLSEAIRTSMFAVSSTTNTGSMNPLLGLADNLKRLENRINLLGTSTSQKTAAYGITASDFFVELTANTATFTLPTAVGVAGKQYIVKNSGTGVLTLATSSSQTIDGMATKNINTQYMGYRVISDGANWKIIGAF